MLSNHCHLYRGDNDKNDDDPAIDDVQPSLDACKDEKLHADIQHNTEVAARSGAGSSKVACKRKASMLQIAVMSCQVLRVNLTFI